MILVHVLILKEEDFIHVLKDDFSSCSNSKEGGFYSCSKGELSIIRTS